MLGEDTQPSQRSGEGREKRPTEPEAEREVIQAKLTSKKPKKRVSVSCSTQHQVVVAHTAGSASLFITATITCSAAEVHNPRHKPGPKIWG